MKHLQRASLKKSKASKVPGVFRGGILFHCWSLQLFKKGSTMLERGQKGAWFSSFVIELDTNFGTIFQKCEFQPLLQGMIINFIQWILKYKKQPLEVWNCPLSEGKRKILIKIKCAYFWAYEKRWLLNALQILLLKPHAPEVKLLKNALLNWGFQGPLKFLLGSSGDLGQIYSCRACKQENKFTENLLPWRPTNIWSYTLYLLHVCAYLYLLF